MTLVPFHFSNGTGARLVERKNYHATGDYEDYYFTSQLADQKLESRDIGLEIARHANKDGCSSRCRLRRTYLCSNARNVRERGLRLSTFQLAKMLSSQLISQVVLQTPKKLSRTAGRNGISIGPWTKGGNKGDGSHLLT